MNILSFGEKNTLVGIRPEEMRLGASGAPAVVEGVEYLGADSIVACAIAGEKVLVRAPGRVTLAPGSETRIAWPAEATHVFDAAPGRRRDDAAPHQSVLREAIA